MLDSLKAELQKMGYDKFKQSTQKVILVYVPKTDRISAMADLQKMPNAILDKSAVMMRKVSSMGAVTFKGGKFNGLTVGVKPDASKGLTTDEQETLAGIFIATKIANPRTDYSFTELQTKGEPLVSSAHKIDALFEKASKGWIESSKKVAEALYPYVKGSTLNVHQRSGSTFESNISTQAKKLLREAGYARMSVDKWNPADIWLVKSSLERTDFTKFANFPELNAFVKEKFDSKDMIAVSLKQVGTRAKVETYNAESGAEIEFDSWDVGKTGFVNALNGTIFFSGGDMVIRNFGRPEGVSGEINGKHAQGGKVGNGPLLQIWAKYDSSFSTMSHQDISQKLTADPDSVFKKLFDDMKALDPDSVVQYPDVDALRSAISGKKNMLNYVISKWQVSDLMKSLKNMSKEKQNHLVNALIGYASSSLDISSVFYKVS